MRARKLVVLLFVAFVLTLGAGVSGGMLLSRLPVARGGEDVDVPPVSGGGGGSPLAAELGLSAKQSEDMRRIWETVRQTARHCLEEGRRLQQDRDDALVAMLTEEQKAKFQQISEDYAEQFADLNRKRDREFEQAVQQTRGILSDEQWKKYERILRSRVEPAALRALPE